MCNVKIGNEFVSSDHKPLIIEFADLLCNICISGYDISDLKYFPDWSDVDGACVTRYQYF